MIHQINGAPISTEDGQAMVEYALIIAVVAVAVTGFSGMANIIIELYQNILTKISAFL